MVLLNVNSPSPPEGGRPRGAPRLNSTSPPAKYAKKDWLLPLIERVILSLAYISMVLFRER